MEIEECSKYEELPPSDFISGTSLFSKRIINNSDKVKSKANEACATDNEEDNNITEIRVSCTSEPPEEPDYLLEDYEVYIYIYIIHL